jgi:hypothetical protein
VAREITSLTGILAICPLFGNNFRPLEFRVLASLQEDIFKVDEVDLHDNFNISQWSFGEGTTPKENGYLESLLMILGNRGANDQFDVLDWWKANQAEYPN